MESSPVKIKSSSVRLSFSHAVSSLSISTDTVFLFVFIIVRTSYAPVIVSIIINNTAIHFSTGLKAQRAFHNDTIAYAQKIFKKIVAMIIYLWFTAISGVIATVNAKTTGSKNAKIMALNLPLYNKINARIPTKNIPDNFNI